MQRSSGPAATELRRAAERALARLAASSLQGAASTSCVLPACDLHIELFPLDGFFVHGKMKLDTVAGVSADFLSCLFGELHCLEHGLSESVAVVRRNDEACIADKLADSAYIGGDDGLFHGHGLSKRQRHSF